MSKRHPRLKINCISARTENIKLPKDVAAYLADKSMGNVRELEGGLKRIAAYSSLTNTKISLAMAKSVLKITLNSPKKVRK